uniref:NADH-ubiquinone oxidoreductase chain 6 n=1 Tax=Hyaloraphidium curvatum TaxID=82268 RepID=Q950T3_HYACU|nr:NADH dehydrogenase subunit 6 [Hyaloraphidium curvatum]AAK83433.1 NADH dehydrogenase subunit 6 [Hyaloraphidium curvatum]
MNYWLFQILLISIVVSGLLVMTSRSPINSVIYLVLVYLAGGGLFLLMDHTFLGLTLIIVYVGAIAILFLFTVFMINLRSSTGSNSLNISQLLLILPALGLIFYLGGEQTDSAGLIFAPNWSNLLARPQEMQMLGDLIFNSYPIALLLVAYLLLVIMVAIIKIHLD